MFMKLWEFIWVSSRYKPFLERMFGDEMTFLKTILLEGENFYEVFELHCKTSLSKMSSI